MEKLTDWKKLWKQLSEIQTRAFAKKQAKDEDFWRHKARDFDKMVEERWAKPDSSRQFLLDKLTANPGSSLLDIGAGTGKWSVLASPYAAKVTALEPSGAMQAVLKEKIHEMNITNIQVFTGNWPEDDPGPHDFILASHSMYGQTDFTAFVQKMSATAVKGCILVMRAPFADAVMAKAAMKVWGQPYDSPNFQIAYNMLLGMDIYPDVIMEADGTWPAWTSDSFEAAMEETKNRLGLADNTSHDLFLWELLAKHLTRQNDGKYVWPKGNRSALVYWDVS
ncbi:MAG TPA: class I SAM-dependent methyltransferase [Desulfotignum sp.]|nr:class I SAM-dependent methyltransferase [Desulfotignum sp.]